MDPLLECSSNVPQSGADALRLFRDAFVTEIGVSELNGGNGGERERLISLRELLDVIVCAGKDVLIEACADISGNLGGKTDGKREEAKRSQNPVMLCERLEIPLPPSLSPIHTLLFISRTCVAFARTHRIEASQQQTNQHAENYSYSKIFFIFSHSDEIFSFEECFQV